MNGNTYWTWSIPFCGALGMTLNSHKSSVSYSCHDLVLKGQTSLFFPLKMNQIDEGVNYLGFYIKPNNYKKTDWRWLIRKIERKMGLWNSKWLS